MWGISGLKWGKGNVGFFNLEHCVQGLSDNFLFNAHCPCLN